ncbi:MAG: peptidoglycan DD-metalloendopeptidase family protein [Chloroflexota bacterium]
MVVVGSAEFILSADSARLLQDLAKAERATRESAQKQAQAIARASGTSVADVKRAADQMAAAHKRAADAAEQAAQRTARATEQANRGLISAAKGAAGFAVGLLGVGTAATAATTAINAVAEAIQRQAQAQFALNKLYGETAPLVTAQAEALAKSSGRSKTEALEASAAVATLGRQYALTSEQQKKVLEISADLAAVRGIPLEEATKRIADALRGEAEAAEYLGQVLNNDAVKAFARMTDEQRKNFETLDPITKAQITLGKLLGDNNDLMGAAAERANSALGAYGKLEAASSSLAATTGGILTPSFVSLTGAITGAVTAADEYLKKIREISEANQKARDEDAAARERALRRGDLRNAGRGLPGDVNGPGGALQTFLEDLGILPRTDPGLPRRTPAPAEESSGAISQSSAAIAQAAKDAKAIADQRAAAERDAIRLLVEERKRAIKDVADAQEKAARDEAKRVDDAIDREKIRLEVEKAGRLKALEERQRATIKTIEAEQRASEAAFEATIERLGLEKQARLDAAQAAKDQAEQAIQDRTRQLSREREIEDRARDDARQQYDRDLEDQRRRQDQQRDAAQDAELRRLEELKDARLGAIDDEIAAEQKRSERVLRNIDRQADRARAASEKAIRGVEDQADAEDERHRAAMQALDDEQDARLDALDVQLKALDAQEKQADAAERMANLQRRASDAERALIKAKGSGDQEAIRAAQQALQDAIRRNDQSAALAARRALDTAAGTGNPEEIEKAERDLADARADIERENVKNATDARRDELEAAKDAIRDEIDARKRAEDEENRRRKRDFDNDKQNERDKLQNRLSALDKKKQGEQDHTKDTLAELRKRRQAEQDDAEEAVRLAREKYDQQTQALREQRLIEDRAIDDRREKEDRDREDYRSAEDERLRLQKEAVDQAYEDERKATDAHYNGPNGVLTIVKDAMDKAKIAYQDRLNDAREKFNQEKTAINEVYRNAAKTGLLDLQDQAAENNRNKLADQTAALASWKEQANQFIDDNKSKWKDLEAAILAVDEAIRGLPKSRVVTVDPDTGINSQGGVGNQPYGPGNGPGQNEPVAVAPAPGTGIGDDQTDVNVSPDRFSVAFGFNQPYTNPFNPAIPNHRGVDLVIPGAENNGRGQPVGAFRGGTVVAATIDPNGGNGIIIRAADGLYDRYFHFDKIYVSNGQSIKRGQQIGILGASGTEGFPHLHYEVSRGINGDPQDRLIDPRPYMRGYARGGLISEPSLLVSMRTGRPWGSIAEEGPELVTSTAQTRARFTESLRTGRPNKEAIIGAPPLANYGRIGDMLAAAHPGSSGGAYADNRVYRFEGIGTDEAFRRLKRMDTRDRVLRSGRSRGPR